MLQTEITKHTFDNLTWIIDELLIRKENSRKILIFVKTIQETSDLYKYILDKMLICDHTISNTLIPENRLVDFIHAKMAQCTINRIVTSYANHSSNLRVLVSTSILSMGIDFNDIDVVVLFGLPECVSQFVQMSGRCARQNGVGLVVAYAPKKV